jgi:hypothetical protein
MESRSEVRPAVVRLKIGDQKSDFAYWQAQSYVRLSSLDEVRTDYHRWKYDAEPGLQRVYRIVKR